MNVRIETLDDIHVARVRHTGPYGEVGPCFGRLFAWAASVGAEPGRCLTLSWDDPRATAPENLRSDACVELRTDAAPPPGVELARIEGGRYAVHTLRGPYDGIAQAYRRLFEDWPPESGEEPGGGPCMEIYRNALNETAPSELLTDLCAPLRPAARG